MATMMAAVYYGQGDLRLEQVPRPLPGRGEVLVRVRYCGICGSDLRTYREGSMPGNLPLPRILGHEFAGDVAELGPGVTGFQPGARVTAAPATSCGQCLYCQRGSQTLCLNALDFGTTQNGAQAEYVLIPAPLLVQALLDSILQVQRIFVAGQGRSGLLMKMFALRLMQLGLAVFVVGDATTPAIGAGDLLIVCSASGETPGAVSPARRAREAEAQVAVIVSRTGSSLSKLAQHTVLVPGETPKVSLLQSSRLPLASVLEQAMLVVLDGVICSLAQCMGQSNQSMMARHANLE